MPDLVRVLMVEDVADDAALIERELRRAGITGAARRVDSERAYREALQTFAPDIILTDHSLPTFGAADALRIALLPRSSPCIPTPCRGSTPRCAQSSRAPARPPAWSSAGAIRTARGAISTPWRSTASRSPRWAPSW